MLTSSDITTNSSKQIKCGKVKTFGNNHNKSNCINDKTKSRLNSGNAYYRCVWDHLFFHQLSKNVKTKIHKTILSSVSYGCEIRSLTQSEHRFSGSDIHNGCSGECLDPRGRKRRKDGENCAMWSFITVRSTKYY